MVSKYDPRHWQNRLVDLVTHPITWAVAGVILVVSLFVWLLVPRAEQVQVSATLWEYTYRVEKYKIRPYDGFEPPGDALEIRSLGERIHHHDRVFSHTERYTVMESCGQSCSGSGQNRSCSTKMCSRSKTRDVYRSVPVYRPYYAWRAWRWDFERKVVVKDQDKPLRLIEDSEFGLNLNLTPGQQERYTRAEDYEVTFANSEKDTWSFEPDTDQEFALYTLGRKMTIEVNSFGSIVSTGIR